MKLSKEVKTGIIVTAGIALFIFGFNFLKGKNLFTSQRTFYAVYTNVQGVVENNPVQINGFKVGRVSNIELKPGTLDNILVTLDIYDGDIQIPKNSIAKIISPDLLGSKAIELVLGNSTEMAKEGDVLISGVQASLSSTVSEELRPLKVKVEGLIASVDSAITVVQVILNKDARDNLGKSFESIRNAIATFEKTAIKIDDMVGSEKDKISSIFSKLETITTTFSKNNEKLNQAIGNINNITDSIAKSNLKSTINNTNEVMAKTTEILNKINNGEGTLGMLINNKKLYEDLDATSISLTRLMDDINKYPGDYLSIFGKKRKKKNAKKTATPASPPKGS